VSAKSTSRASQTNWARVGSLKDRDIKVSRSHPEGDPLHIMRGIVRKGLKPFSPKRVISLRVDPDVLEWFRAQGAGWQTRMNEVLKAYKEAAARSRRVSRRSSGRVESQRSSPTR